MRVFKYAEEAREECSFEKWYKSVYILDDLVGFYQFCIEKGESNE